MESTRVAFVHCIENKHQRMFERQGWLFLETLKHTNIDLYNCCNHYFIQPTELDVSEQTLAYFAVENINFVKEPQLSKKQLNPMYNYTNICLTVDYFSKCLSEEYLCWSDTDIMWLQPLTSELFKETTKPVITVTPMPVKAEHSYPLQEFDVFDTKYQMNEFYLSHIKDHLPEEFKVDNLTHYANTWFLYAPTKHRFWNDWKNLTFILLGILQSHHLTDMPYHIEGYCEELAASIMYSMNPSDFTKIDEFMDNIYVIDQDCDKFDDNTVIFHYSGLAPAPYEIIDDNLSAKQVVMNMLKLAGRENMYDFKNDMLVNLTKKYVNAAK